MKRVEKMGALAAAASHLLDDRSLDAGAVMQPMFGDRGSQVCAIAVNALAYAAGQYAAVTGQAPSEVAQQWALALAQCEEVQG